jgi:four helix bundle suffix protein
MLHSLHLLHFSSLTMPEHFIPPHGGYRKLFAFQRAEVVYDATVRFCARFLDRRDRTTDQMIQAARSGKQNIIEGSMASGTSKETEIKLTNVARASLEELLADYEDFLRSRKLPLWNKDHPRAVAIRQMARAGHSSNASYAAYVEQGTPEESANTVICLVHQANYLLDQHIRRLETTFVQEGGLRERMTRARLVERVKQEGRIPPEARKP